MDPIPLEDNKILNRDMGSCLWFEDQSIPEQGTSLTHKRGSILWFMQKLDLEGSTSTLVLVQAPGSAAENQL